MSLHLGTSPVMSAEWRAEIRGREVVCRWIDGIFQGDAEVIARLIHVAGAPPRADTLEEARLLISCALVDVIEHPLSHQGPTP